MFGWFRNISLRVFKFDSSDNKVRSVFGDDDSCFPLDRVVQFIIDGIAKRAWGTLSYSTHNLFCVSRVRNNPRLSLHPEYVWKTVRTMTYMSANSAVIVNCNILAYVIINHSRLALIWFRVVKTVLQMCVVAIRFGRRATAAAEYHGFFRFESRSVRRPQISDVLCAYRSVWNWFKKLRFFVAHLFPLTASGCEEVKIIIREPIEQEKSRLNRLTV